MHSYFKRKEFPALIFILSYISFVFIKHSCQVADSISIAALCAFYCYMSYLQSLENPKLEKEVADHKEIVNIALNKIREDFSKDVKKINDEMVKMSLGSNKVSLFNNKKVSF